MQFWYSPATETVRANRQNNCFETKAMCVSMSLYSTCVCVCCVAIQGKSQSRHSKQRIKYIGE